MTYSHDKTTTKKSQAQVLISFMFCHEDYSNIYSRISKKSIKEGKRKIWLWMMLAG